MFYVDGGERLKLFRLIECIFHSYLKIQPSHISMESKICSKLLISRNGMGYWGHPHNNIAECRGTLKYCHPYDHRAPTCTFRNYILM